MWWVQRNKAKEDERLRVQMQLAMSVEPDPYEYMLTDMKNQEIIRRLDMEIREQHKLLIRDTVEIAQRSGLIDHDEYAKYLLDETGLYIPKLKDIM